MYNTTEEVKAALSLSVLRLRLVLADSTVIDDTLANIGYSAGCCDGDIGIGSVSAASLSGTIHGVQNLLGVTFTAQVGVDVDGVTQWLNLGTFTVTECNRTDDSTTFTAYDAAYTALSAVYTPTVQSGATVYAVLENLALQCGLDVEQTTLNYGLQIPVAGTLTGHTCREMLGYLAALCGKNAVITRDGKVRFVFFELTEQTVTANDYYSGAMSNGGNSKLWGLSCTVPGQEEEQTLTVGNAEKAVPVSCPYMTQAQLNAIWYTIGGYEYPVGNVSFYRGLLTEPGDVVSLTNLAGVTISFPAMQVNLEIDGGCRCTISSFGKSDAVRISGTAGPTEKRLQSVQSTASRALLSANGKNKNFYQASAPTTADGLTPGDLWFDTANGNRVSEWTGSAWTLRPFGALAVTNLDAGSITAGTLNAARIGAGSITADKLDVADLLSQNLTVTGSFQVQTANYAQTITNEGYILNAKSEVDGTQHKSELRLHEDGAVGLYGTQQANLFSDGLINIIGERVDINSTQDPLRIYGAVIEGSFLNTASGDCSHAEGSITTASGDSSHAEGGATVASGDCSHAEGSITTASGDNSHASGYYTIASTDNQFVIGRFNEEDSTKAFIIGNGSADYARSNAFAVDWNGAVSLPNNTWNDVGDDVQIGDCNRSGRLGIKGKNDYSGLFFAPSDAAGGSTGVHFYSDGNGRMLLTSGLSSSGNISGANLQTPTIRGMWAGTTVINLGNSTNPQVFSDSDFYARFGYHATGANTVALISDGDAGASGGLLMTGSVHSDGRVLVTLNRSFNGLARLNYLIIRIGD